MPSAPLSPLSLVVMGAKGLNLQSSSSLLEPVWATKAQNMVFDQAGRLASRNGWSVKNITPMSGSPAVGQIFEYVPTSGANQIVSTGGNKIYSGTTTLTDVTGALVPTANNWKFVNYNGNTYGLQASHPLIVWNGSGNFAAVTAASGTVPDGNELLSAFGRLWGVDTTGQVIKYCNLLDPTNWSIAGAGSINVTSVWGTGNDSIIALASYNDLLVVFGSRNIIIFQDGSSGGSKLGLDPINIRVVDLIAGIGCIARDSVQNVNGDDLVFLSAAGVQSLKRVIIERSNAIQNISRNIRDYLAATAGSELASGIRSTYNPVNGFYLLLAPLSKVIFCFDTKVTLDDGTWRATVWDNFIPTALTTLKDNSTTYSGKTGQIFQYLGQDDNGTSYNAIYESGWLDLDPQIRTRLKMLKRLECVFANTGGGVLTVKWAYDFSDSFFTAQHTLPVPSTAEWGLSEYGLDEWGGGQTIFNVKDSTSSGGQFVKVGAQIPINNSMFALQQLQLFAKVGRMI